ncbi:MAG: hypothetical protein JRI25_16235 [Deltaproteobacteria bacterium]|nr:hypothetical protein [Deltaproteobacteria bacterium]
MARWACLFLCAMWPFVAGAVEQVEVWGTSEEPGVPEAFQAWHTQYEDDGNYGESWFFMTHTSEGGALYALLSITNLGLRTYDGSIDIQYYPPEGEAHRYHREVRRAELAGSEEQMDITVGGGHAWGGGRAYHLEVDASTSPIEWIPTASGTASWCSSRTALPSGPWASTCPAARPGGA